MEIFYILYQQPEIAYISLFILMLWSLIWKGIALWHSARYKQKKWFIFILILNTMGILPLIYLIRFRPKEFHPLALKQIRVTKPKKK